MLFITVLHTPERILRYWKKLAEKFIRRWRLKIHLKLQKISSSVVMSNTSNKRNHQSPVRDRMLRTRYWRLWLWFISMFSCSSIVKLRGKMPYFVCFIHWPPKWRFEFLSCATNRYPLGVDKKHLTLVLSTPQYFTTTSCRVRSNDPNEHPIFMGPVFLHRGAVFVNLFLT